MIEILAPAGDENSFNVALNSGADAIYLGLGKFNARQKANNFNKENLTKCVRRAHLFNVKVYLTVNTLINNDEILPFISLIKDAISAKVDAFIVQDLGASYLLKKYFKNIVLHASTQMGVHNLSGALVLEKLGFKRVVLSRETSLQDIIDIKKNTNLEIEYFVQGALCVAFSGNCYISSLLNNKSGNRGECLQLCRLKYSSFEKDKFLNEGYLLSTTDLCLLSRLKELIDAGVTSFKIEGRLKRESYIAQTVKSYKNAILNLDKIDINEEENKLKKIFNRGNFNRGYYLENKKLNFINYNFPNHRGEKIGIVINVSNFKNIYKIELNINKKIDSGCGIKFVYDGEELSIGVGNIQMLKNGNYLIYSSCKPKINSEVYLTLDKNYEDNLIKNKRKLEINIKFTSHIGQKPILVVNYNNIEIKEEADIIIEKAKNFSCSIESVINSLNKLNDTVFVAKNFDIDIEDVFLPVSVLNNLRRSAISKLEEKILLNNIVNVEFDENIDNLVKNELNNININKFNCDYKIVDENILLNQYDKNIIFAPTIYNNNIFSNFFNEVKNKNLTNLYLYIPPILKFNEINLINNLLSSYNFKGVYINNISGLNFANNKEIIASYMLNITNLFALKNLLNLGVKFICNSIEYFASKISNCSVIGNIALMNYCHCPYQVNYNSTCNSCSFNNKLKYKLNKNVFDIRRTKIVCCYFEMLYNINKKDIFNIYDLRNL